MTDKDLTANIVSAHVSNNTVAVGDMASLIKQVHQALCSIGTQDAEPKQKLPAVSAKSSVKPDYIVCMECGKKQKTLKRHLQAGHGMTVQQYKQKYRLPDAYPMTAPNYSERRREMAQKFGLGRKERSSNKAKPKGKKSS